MDKTGRRNQSRRLTPGAESLKPVSSDQDSINGKDSGQPPKTSQMSLKTNRKMGNCVWGVSRVSALRWEKRATNCRPVGEEGHGVLLP